MDISQKLANRANSVRKMLLLRGFDVLSCKALNLNAPSQQPQLIIGSPPITRSTRLHDKFATAHLIERHDESGVRERAYALPKIYCYREAAYVQGNDEFVIRSRTRETRREKPMQWKMATTRRCWWMARRDITSRRTVDGRRAGTPSRRGKRAIVAKRPEKAR